MTILWTYASGANSLSPTSVTGASVSNAVANGTAMNGSYSFLTTINHSCDLFHFGSRQLRDRFI